MSEGFRAKGESGSAGAGGWGSPGAAGGVLRRVVYLGLAGALAVIAFATFRLSQERAHVTEAQDRLVASRGLIAPDRKRLAADYTDKQNRLLADVPTDPTGWLDPETLVLAHYEDADAETQLVDWEGLQAELAKTTGKKIVAQEYLNSAEDVAAIKAGKIQIVAVHAADAPYLVNFAGLIPFGVLGTEAGASGNRLDIAVAPNSKIKTLADLRGHTLTCTRPDSITGYRAAIAVLSQEAGMRPFVDYSLNWSYSQTESILGVIGGSFTAAALSDDKLQSLLKKESVKPADFRIIYESQVIPRLTIGHVYNLRPELATTLTTAVFDFQNEKGAPSESAGKPMCFFAIDYKKDFEFVRKIDDSFDPRFGSRPRTKPVSAPEGAATQAQP